MATRTCRGAVTLAAERAGRQVLLFSGPADPGGDRGARGQRSTHTCLPNKGEPCFPDDYKLTLTLYFLLW